MELVEILQNLLSALLYLRNFLAASMSSYMPYSLAMQIATVIYMLLPTSMVYTLFRFFDREKIDKVVFFVLISLWILLGVVILLAKVVFS